MICKNLKPINKQIPLSRVLPSLTAWLEKLGSQQWHRSPGFDLEKNCGSINVIPEMSDV